MHHLMRVKSSTAAFMTYSNMGRVCALALFLSLAVACQGTSGGAESEQANVPAVEAVPARSGALPLEARVNGVVKARNQVAIRPEIEGRVIEVLVRSGEPVRQGDPLVRLEAQTLREQVRQEQARVRLAEARLAELTAQIGRTRSLAEDGLVSPLALETQEAQVAAAEATLDEARATLEEIGAMQGRATVRAPVSGRVGRRDVEVGQLVDSGSVLFVVGDLDELIVEVPLTEEVLAHAREQQPVRITAESLADPLRAEMSRISPFLAAESFTTSGEIDIDNPEGRLLPGMFVTVDLLFGESDVTTLVPTSAVVWLESEGGRRGLYVIEDSAGLTEAGEAQGDILPEARAIHFAPVEVLAESRGVAGVEGIAAGDWVVTLGQHLLEERAKQQGEEADGSVAARVRPNTWQRVLDLQRLQRQDLLTGFMDKQQRLARELGAEIPESEDVVDAILAERGDGPGGQERPTRNPAASEPAAGNNAR